MAFVIEVKFLDKPQRPSVVMKGRDAWALACLAEAGRRGVAPVDTPGPRWSAYVFNLKRRGFNIETRHESHGPPFPGTHARYVLRDAVSVELNSSNTEGGGK